MAFDLIERGLYQLSSFVLGSDTDAHCQLDYNLDEHTFVTTSGSLLTLYHLIGSRRLIGKDEFESQCDALAKEISKLLRAGSGGRQHSVLFGFRSDRSAGRSRIAEILSPSLRTAERFGADVEWYFDDVMDSLSKHVIDEVAVFGVMTHRAGLTPPELERATEDTIKRRGKLRTSGVKLSPHTQMSTIGPVSLLVARHNAALVTIEEAISSPNGQVKVMLDRQTCHQASRLMRRFLDAGAVPAEWRPQLVGDKPSGLHNPRRDESDVMALPKRIGRQLVTEKLTDVFGDAEMVKKGKTFYASLALDVFPQDDNTPNFSDLTDAIKGQIPWQVNFQINPKGLSYRQLEKMFSSIFGAAGDHNRSIKQGWDELREFERSGDSVGALRAVFTTWSEDRRICVDNLSFLRSKIESWGQTVVTNETARPAEAFLASVPGYSSNMPVEYIPGPISSIARLMPAFMPSSVWNSGQLLMHTQDGRPYPVYLGTHLQSYWGTLMLAPTGSGKSFLMNMLNTGAVFSPGLTELPMITVIDKGPSGKGTINLLKALLPPHLASQCIYLRPTQSDASFTSNPLDTQLGCDRPMASDRDFCNAVLGAMSPGLGPEGGKFLNRTIEILYEYFDRRSSTAKKWQPSMNLEIHALLERVGITYNEANPPRVWAVEDALFQAGMIPEASEVHRYAVPTILDINTVLNADPRVKKEYEESKTDDGIGMVAYFLRSITAAQNQYKLFCGVSRFKGSERIMIIDTEGLAAASSSEEGKRIYGLALLFARRLGARNFFLHKDDIATVTPKLYAEYHALRAQKIREQLKFLEYDEIHNARGIAAVQDLIQKDAREGRKYNIVTVLSSQELGDFPKELVNNSFNFFILGVGSGTAAREIKERFDLSDSEIKAITQECTVPGKLFAMFRVNNGMLSQILNTRPGAIQKWAFSTSANDETIRDKLYEKFGEKRTLMLLAKEYPGGSARPAIERLRAKMGHESSDNGITSIIVDSLIPKFAEMS